MNQKGFPIIIIAIIIIIAVVGFFIYQRRASSPANPTTINQGEQNAVSQQSQLKTEVSPSSTASVPPKPTATQIPTPTPSSLSPFTDKFLMAFLACNNSAANCGDPRNHQTFLAQSNDGATWTLVSGVQPLSGSVPDVIRRGNTLYIFSPGTVARYHLNTGKIDLPQPVAITAGNDSNELFVDPSVTFDANGNLVLFYLLGQIGSDPAHCPPGESSCTKVIRSATEVSGSDGTRFIVDPGDRADISINGQETASDPAIIKDPNGYSLLISRGPSVEVMTSSNLRGTFKDIPTLSGGMLVSNLGGVPDGYYDSASGQYWIYITSGMNNSVIRRAVSNNITSPLAENQFSTVLSGSNIGLGSSFMVASPGITSNQP